MPSLRRYGDSHVEHCQVIISLEKMAIEIEKMADEALSVYTREQRNAICCDIRKAALKLIDLSPKERQEYRLAVK